MLKTNKQKEEEEEGEKLLKTEDDKDSLIKKSVAEPIVTKKKNLFHFHSIYPSCSYPVPKPIRFIDSEISSNLVFQKLLYFNTFYSGLFFYILLASHIYRWMVFEQDIYNILRLVFIFIPWAIIEIFRINHGYTGNIKETFPEILSFLIQTFINFAIVIVFLAFKKKLPVEVAVLSLQVVFYSLELIMCIVTISNLSKSQSALFFWNTPYQKNKFVKREEVKQKQARQELLAEKGPAYDKSAQKAQFGEQGAESIQQFNQSAYNENYFGNQDNLRNTQSFYQTGQNFGNTVQSQLNYDNRLGQSNSKLYQTDGMYKN